MEVLYTAESVEACWDCPIPWTEVLGQFARLFAATVAGVVMQEARRQPIRALGWILTVLALFWAVVYTSVIPRWGISNGGVPLEVWPRRMSWLILIGFDVMLVAIVVVAYRRRSAKQLPDLVP